MNTLIQKRGFGGLLSVLFLSLTAFLFTACNDDMDVQQAYPFTVETMPVPTRIVKGETVEIRCELKREGRFSDARYTIRYFQPDGKGTLRCCRMTAIRLTGRCSGCITLPRARTGSRLTSILRTTANRNSCSCSVLISTTKGRRRLKRKRKGLYPIPELLGSGIRSLL
jgi:hypothetical protein